MLTAPFMIIRKPSPRTATLVVAASDASPKSKRGADYICDGTADEVEINAAIDALPAAGGKVVLSEGAFTLANSIIVIDGLTLEGQGYSTLIQYDDTIAGPAGIGHHDGTTYRQVDDVTIKNLRIKNTDTDSEKFGINIGWSDNIPQRITVDHVEFDGCGINIYCGSSHRIEHCYVHGIRTTGTPIDCAIAIRGVTTNYSTNSTIANNRIDDISDMGIHSNSSDGISILNNFVTDVNQRNPGEIFAIDTATAVNVLIKGNNIESSSGILAEDNTATSNAGTVSIVDNIVRSTTRTAGFGIQVWRVADYDHFLRVLIEGNVVNGAFTGIRAGDLNQVAIIGNLIDDIGQAGISVDKTQVGEEPSSVLVEGNTVLNWAAEVAGDYGSAISADVENATIQDNYCKDVSADNNSTGISWVENPGWILNNTILNCASSEMFNVEAGVVIRNNQGYATENSGTATLVNGQTSIVVTHGLAVTPVAGDIMVTPMESLGSASEFYIDTYTSTQFTIHVDSDPSADVDFAWKAVVL